VGADRSNDLFKFRFEDERPGPTVLKDELEFGSGQSPVKRNQDGTDFGEAQEDFNILMTIMKQNSDPVALFHPHFEKEVAELVAPMVHFLIREGMTLIIQGLLLWLQETPFSYPVANVHFTIFSTILYLGRYAPIKVMPIMMVS